MKIKKSFITLFVSVIASSLYCQLPVNTVSQLTETFVEIRNSRDYYPDVAPIYLIHYNRHILLMNKKTDEVYECYIFNRNYSDCRFYGEYNEASSNLKVVKYTPDIKNFIRDYRGAVRLENIVRSKM
jgi:hypothetical protein